MFPSLDAVWLKGRKGGQAAGVHSGTLREHCAAGQDGGKRPCRASGSALSMSVVRSLSRIRLFVTP